MSNDEIIEGEAEEIGTAVEVRAPAAVSLFQTDDPVAVVERATKVADALARVIEQKNLYQTIRQRKHVNVEGWTLLGSMLGVFPVVEWTRPVDGGWEARVTAQTRNGEVVGAAEAMCSRAESAWKNRDDYAIRSMAQTRAVSKALRHPLGFVMTLAGYEATPEAEIPDETPAAKPSMRGSVPTSWAELDLYLSGYPGDDTLAMFKQFGAAARKLLFADKELEAEDKAELWKISVGAALELNKISDPGKFPPPSIEDMRQAWASQLDGRELAIPGEE